MLSRVIVEALLVAATVLVHIAGAALALRTLVPLDREPPVRIWPVIWLLVRLTWLMILIHAAEIGVWGFFYLWSGCLPDAESAMYFSGVTYTTVGYGDLVLPKEWRALAPIEGLIGILMCGLSTSIFFATVNRIFVTRSKAKSGASS
jgi:hypothetical protein